MKNAKVDAQVTRGNLGELFTTIDKGAAAGVCSSVHCEGCLLECDKGIHCDIKGRKVLPHMTAYLLGDVMSHDNPNCIQCGQMCQPENILM